MYSQLGSLALTLSLSGFLGEKKHRGLITSLKLNKVGTTVVDLVQTFLSWSYWIDRSHWEKVILDTDAEPCRTLKVSNSVLNFTWKQRIVTWEHTETPIATWAALRWNKYSFWVVFNDSLWSAKCNNPKRRWLRERVTPAKECQIGTQVQYICAKQSFNHNYHLLFQKELWVQENLHRMNQFCRSKHDHIMNQRWDFASNSFLLINLELSNCGDLRLKQWINMPFSSNS